MYIKKKIHLKYRHEIDTVWEELEGKEEELRVELSLREF